MSNLLKTYNIRRKEKGKCRKNSEASNEYLPTHKCSYIWEDIGRSKKCCIEVSGISLVVVISIGTKEGVSALLQREGDFISLERIADTIMKNKIPNVFLNFKQHSYDQLLSQKNRNYVFSLGRIKLVT